MATILVKIIAGDIPCYKVAEDEHFLLFLDINPLVKGHTLVVPKREVDYIFDLKMKSWLRFMFAKSVARPLNKPFPCKVGRSCRHRFEVPHAHIHLFPSTRVR